MSVTSQLSKDGKAFTVAVSGRFDFRVYESFRDSYAKVKPAGIRFMVDLQKANYMDSSALGMLLLLKEHVGDSGSIEIINTATDVRNVLTIANFDKLFKIS